MILVMKYDTLILLSGKPLPQPIVTVSIQQMESKCFFLVIGGSGADKLKLY